MKDHEDVGTVADVRAGRSPHAAVVAAASVFVPITLVAWVSWQIMEGEGSTLLRSEFSRWALVTVGVAALTCVVAGVFWRTGKVRVGVLVGVLLAALAVGVGLLVDVATSGGFS